MHRMGQCSQSSGKVRYRSYVCAVHVAESVKYLLDPVCPLCRGEFFERLQVQCVRDTMWRSGQPPDAFNRGAIAACLDAVVNTMVGSDFRLAEQYEDITEAFPAGGKECIFVSQARHADLFIRRIDDCAHRRLCAPTQAGLLQLDREWMACRSLGNISNLLTPPIKFEASCTRIERVFRNPLDQVVPGEQERVALAQRFG